MGTCLSKDDGGSSKNNYILQRLDDHEAGINCMSLSEDKSILVTGSEDRTARLWSTKSVRCECVGILKGHDDYVNCVLCAAGYVITASADKTIRKWRAASCDCVHVFRGHASIINRIISTGDYVFSSSYDKSVRCWDLESGECIRVFSGHKRGVYPMVFVPSADSGHQTSGTRISSEITSMVKDTSKNEEEDSAYFDWETGSKDILLSGAADYTVRSWSFETGRCIKIFKGHTGAITCMSADDKGKLLYTGSTDQLIRSWNIASGQVIKTFQGHTQAITCMTLEGRILYTGSSDMTARAWICEFGDCTRVFKGHKHTVSAIRFYKGLLYTACGDGLCRVFDAKSATSKRIFRGHSGAANVIELVDGKLFTGSHDARLIVWDAKGINRDTGFGGTPANDTANNSTARSMEPSDEKLLGVRNIYETYVSQNEPEEKAEKKVAKQIMIGDDDLDDEDCDDLEPDCRMSQFTGNIRQVRVRP